jgi:hypothetical protein
VVKRLLAMPSLKTLKELNIQSYKERSSKEDKDDVGESVIKQGERESDNKKEETTLIGDCERDQIVLFVRIDGMNYCCLGRLAYIAFNLHTQPIEFEWELLDYERIKDSVLFKQMRET